MSSGERKTPIERERKGEKEMRERVRRRKDWERIRERG